MTLAAGTKLGPYEIVAPLGAGGMGEVYKAKDTRLNRFVAVKILPESFAKDADAAARFEREARAVAALNHPNILSIFDVGDAGGVAYAVTELLEGEPLRSRLEGGTALSPRRAVEIGVAIAHGLAAAHEKGIVHRDLKPENVFLTADGRVKILDFGLAKRIARETSETGAPTAAAGTEPGTVMGTVGYMSPEQVRGREVDHRSDIFSFGAMLYEMLSGTRAFRGDSAVETMSAILKEDPPELLESGKNVSPALDRIVRHCLEKNPEARFQSSRDVAFDLEILSDTASSGKASAIAPRRRLRPVGIALALAAAAAVGALLERGMRPAPPAPAFQRLTFRRGTVTAARFASDGKTVVYSAQWEGRPSEVFSISSAGQESRPLELADAMLLSVSSADELAVKLRPKLWSGHLHGTLARVPLAGGSPRELLEAVQEADWSADGGSLALVRLVEGSRWSIEYPAGKRLAEEHESVNAMRLSPDGRTIALAEGAYPWWLPSIVVVDRAGKKKVMGRYEPTGLAWSRRGDEIWFTSDEAAGATDIEAVDLSGRHRLVYRSAGSIALEDISRSGDLLVGLLRRQESAMFHAPGAARDVDLAWHEGSAIMDISPDGKTVLISEQGQTNSRGSAFYLRKTDGSPAVRLGEGGGPAVFSVDGKWVLAAPIESKRELLLVPTGAGEAKKVPLPIDLSQWWFFPDGKRILVSGILPNGQSRLYTIDLDGKAYRPIAPDGVDTFIGEMPLSPDGKLVAAQGSTRMQTMTLKLYPTDGVTAPRDVPGFEQDDVMIRWADDGHSFFVFKRNELPARIFRLDVETGKRTPWLEVMPPDPAGVTRIPTIAMSPDGRTYAYNFVRELSDLYRIQGLK